jgi:two-component system sensor histidine kinase KdpD
MSIRFPKRISDLPRKGAAGYFLAVAACGVAVLLAWLLAPWLAPANTVMLFLLAVFLVALHLGRRPALLAAFVAVAVFDFFFVQPHFSFAVADAQYLVTFAVMLAVALITGQLAARLGQQAEAALAREAHTRALYELARELAGAVSVAQVAETTTRFLEKELRATSSLLLPDADDKLQAVAEGHAVSRDFTLPRRAYQRGEPVEVLGFSGRGVITLFLPLLTPMRARGVLEITLEADRLHQERTLLDAVASLAAIAVERLHYAAVAQATEMRMAAERLRHSVLASLSHDLRTPLTALVGLADTLLMEADPATHRETAQALREQAMALARMVDNLLDLARLSGGGLALRREWQPLEEVAGAAIKLLGPALDGHPVSVRLPADLPLLEFDSVLLERVIGNLLDNAAKFAPAATPILVEARLAEGQVEVDVCDRGPGFPSGLDLAEPFVRGVPESNRPGIGLGLAICKAIVEAHGGHLSLINPPEGGACARFTLPLGTPPVIEEESPWAAC